MNDFRQKTGEFLIRGGNTLTKFRDKTSPYYGIHTALTEETWGSTIFFCGGVLSDGLDGTLVRLGSKLLGIETTDQGAVDDPAADKKLVNSSELGLGVRFLQRQDYVGFCVLAVNCAVSQWRDHRMENDRNLALQMDYDPKAIGVNKAKTGLQFLGLGILVSPLAKQKQYEQIGLSLVSTGTLLGVLGESIYRRRVQNHVLAVGAAIAEACPDEITIIFPEPVPKLAPFV